MGRDAEHDPHRTGFDDVIGPGAIMKLKDDNTIEPVALVLRSGSCPVAAAADKTANQGEEVVLLQALNLCSRARRRWKATT